MMRPRQRRAKFMLKRLIRVLCGVLITVGVLHFLWERDLHEWLFPMLFLTGLLVAWVTGPPWRWLVAAACLWIQSGVTIASAIGGPLMWFYGGNVIAAVLGQSETLVLTAVFSMVTSAGGLCGWAIASLVTTIYQYWYRDKGTRTMS